MFLLWPPCLAAEGEGPFLLLPVVLNTSRSMQSAQACLSSSYILFLHLPTSDLLNSSSIGFVIVTVLG